MVNPKLLSTSFLSTWGAEEEEEGRTKRGDGDVDEDVDIGWSD